MFDTHVHSVFSGDCDIIPDKMIERAININATGVCFTDHLDIDYPVSNIDFDFNHADYSDYIDEMKIKYKDRIIVGKGLEAGLQPHVYAETDKVISEIKPDFVICSIHCVKSLELHNGDFCKGKSKKEAFEEYFEEMYKMICEYSNYDVVGHFDIIRRYGGYKDNTLNIIDFLDIIDETLKVVISNGKGIEINASGFRYNLNSTLPGFDLIKRYKELGGEIITIGSDAHTEDFLFDRFEYIMHLLNKSSFKYYTYFMNREANYIKIS